MRIGINLLFLVPGDVGGSEPLLTNLVLAVARPEHEIVVFALRGFAGAYPEIREATTVVSAPWSSGAQAVRIAAEHSWLAFEAARRKLDVLHHGVGTAPFLKTSPTVVTIHDVQYLHHPENFVRAKRAWLGLNVPFTARRSDVLTVTSNFVKNDLVRAFRVAPAKVVVVPFGSERLFGPAPLGPDEVRERYRLERPFFLFPGRTYPHKNHRFLIEAYAPLAGEADLVLTGAPWFRDPEIGAAARHLRLTGKVRHLGRVPRAHLGGLYRAAVALAYPTRFEGFGAPVLEAMSSGCPVVSSNAAALPEVVGDAGVLLDPDDLEGWRQMLAGVLRRPELRAELADRGRRRAAEFTWRQAGELQLAAYKQAAGK